jgi:hypothetical protein
MSAEVSNRLRREFRQHQCIYIYMTQDVGDQKATVLNESRTLQLVAQTTSSCKAALEYIGTTEKRNVDRS